MCFAFGPVVYFFYPETANRTLEDMDEIFINNPSAFVFTNRDATQSKRPQVFVEAEAARIAQSANYSSQDAGFSGNEKSGNEKVTSPEESALEV